MKEYTERKKRRESDKESAEAVLGVDVRSAFSLVAWGGVGVID